MMQRLTFRTVSLRNNGLIRYFSMMPVVSGGGGNV